MIGEDLFKEVTDHAETFGWTMRSDLFQKTRVYDRANVTVRVYANISGTAIVGASRSVDGRLQVQLIGKHPAKRATVISWLREEEA